MLSCFRFTTLDTIPPPTVSIVSHSPREMTSARTIKGGFFFRILVMTELVSKHSKDKHNT